MHSQPPRACAKGIMFRSVLTLAESKLGASRSPRILERLPDDLADALRYSRIVPSGWYAVTWFRALIAAAVHESGASHFARELGHDALRLELGQVYRAMARMLAPDTFVSAGVKHFGRMYTVGGMDLLESRAGYARVYWHDCTDFDRQVWEYLHGACVSMIELSGGKAVRFGIVRGGHGAECEAHAHWE